MRQPYVQSGVVGRKGVVGNARVLSKELNVIRFTLQKQQALAIAFSSWKQAGPNSACVSKV